MMDKYPKLKSLSLSLNFIEIFVKTKYICRESGSEFK